MTDIDVSALDRELEKGATELLGSLYPLLYRLEERGWINGAWVEKPGEPPAPVLSVDADRAACAGATAPDLGPRL
jgi:hypothetical protein